MATVEVKGYECDGCGRFYPNDVHRMAVGIHGTSYMYTPDLSRMPKPVGWYACSADCVMPAIEVAINQGSKKWKFPKPLKK